MQSWNASDGCRFDGHEKIEIVTVAIRLTLESREARGADGGVVAVLSYRSLSGGMRGRREFIAALVSAAAWPVVTRGQQPSAVRRVGVLFPGVLGGERERLITEGLISELGGERAVLLVRSAEGNSQLLGSIERISG